ncbi:MAG: hypothetical protein GX371_09950 [Bacteroidales bacterium]|nr:hypothetical protein [Bacteroidales bacterium]
MSYSIQYKQLFRVDILHRYFLDRGTDKFEVMQPAHRAKQLERYSLHGVLNIAPTQETNGVLKGYHLIFKPTGSGFAIWTKISEREENTPFIEWEDDLTLTFLLQVKDPLFYNYTELKPENAGKLFYLSNRKPDSGADSFPLLQNGDEYLTVNEQLMLSKPESEKVKEKMDPRELFNLIGILRVHMTGEAAQIVTPTPVFSALFENRKTYWRYLFNADQPEGVQELLVKEEGDARRWVTKVAYPLTRSGFISLKLNGTELPNPGVSMIKPDPATHNVFSEIYM